MGIAIAATRKAWAHTRVEKHPSFAQSVVLLSNREVRRLAPLNRREYNDAEIKDAANGPNKESEPGTSA